MKTKNQMNNSFFANKIITQTPPILQLLRSVNQSLLMRRNSTILVLNLCFTLSIVSEGFTSRVIVFPVGSFTKICIFSEIQENSKKQNVLLAIFVFSFLGFFWVEREREREESAITCEFLRISFFSLLSSPLLFNDLFQKLKN